MGERTSSAVDHTQHLPIIIREQSKADHLKHGISSCTASGVMKPAII